MHALTDADAVIDLFERGAVANISAPCRSGSVDVISPPGRLIATGDLHDNPEHFERLLEIAGLRDQDPESARCHLTLHEIIHSDRLIAECDFSYRALARVAGLKARFPGFVHVLLANHELAQMLRSPILKGGVKCVQAFEAGLAYVFGPRAQEVERSIDAFVRSMPLALRVHGRSSTGRAIELLCSHSLPNPAMMGRFDPGVLWRELDEADYEPRQGSAHLMVWGRGYDHELLEDLVERWGVDWFIVGHEHAEMGCALVPPNAVVLNSDHEMGVYLPLDLEQLPSADGSMALVRRLTAGV